MKDFVLGFFCSKCFQIIDGKFTKTTRLCSQCAANNLQREIEKNYVCCDDWGFWER